MSLGVSRALIAAACLFGLAGCESSKTPLFGAAQETTASTPEAAQAKIDPADLKPRPVYSATEATGSIIAPVPRPVEPEPGVGAWAAATDPADDLVLGKRHYREENYGKAEEHFRRVVEQDNVPAQRKAEAWVGLAASYDRLKRFDLADRAYAAAIRILGPTPEILNNQGFSYTLRGDYDKARAKLSQAVELDPTNPYIRNNIELLERSVRGGGGKKRV